jgi:hypothetical protein
MAVVQIIANERAELSAENRRLREENLRLRREVERLRAAAPVAATRAVTPPDPRYRLVAGTPLRQALAAPSPAPEIPAADLDDASAVRFALLELDL